MSTSSATARTERTQTVHVGDHLREWRQRRHLSQLDLAGDAEISARHLSFVETGRAAPSRDMVLRLAERLEVPLRERNELLMAAGYAPLYSDTSLQAPIMDSISKALQRVLRQHEPYPAVVMDRHWNVVMTNDAAPQLFNCFIDMAKRPMPRNLLHLMFDPNGMRPFVANWPQVARGLLARVYREALGRVIDEKTRTLLAELSQYPGVKTEWRAPSPDDTLPMIPITLVKDGVRLSYFSMITTVGTPQAVTSEELRLECLFPADDATEAGHDRFIGANSQAASTRH